MSLTANCFCQAGTVGDRGKPIATIGVWCWDGPEFDVIKIGIKMSQYIGIFDCGNA